MKEVFESTIDNISELEVKGYSDPVKMERTMEIWVKRGDEEYLYKFTGPGVGKFEADADGHCWIENKKLEEAYEKLQQENTLNKETADTWSKECHSLYTKIDKLQEENKYLKKENEDFGNQILDYIEMNNRLRLGKEEREVSAVAAKEKNKLLEIENGKLKKELHSLKQERTNIPKTHSSRSDILDQAKKCVCGQREQDYGTPESNFQLIADLWNGYLGTNYRYVDDDRPINVAPLRPLDVSMLMALLKIARIRNGGGSGDSFVDLAGYAACGGEIWHGERHKDK